MESLKDANSSNYEVAIALLKMHGEVHKKNGADAWTRDVLDSVSDIEAHVKALESHNSSALKELRTKVQKRRDYLESISEMDSTDYRANEAEMLGLDWVLENVL